MAATSSEMTITKNILMNDALLQYIFNTSVYPREDECMKELRHITMNHPMKIMGSPPDELQFLALLIKLMNAKNTLEIGVFTGCSLLATALAIPHDGKVVAIDVNREFYELGLPVIKKAGVEHKIDFREGTALTILDELLSEEKNKEAFDFIFIDADKANYLNYHEKGLQLMKVGGLIAYDNTLWNGYVAGLPDGFLDERDKIITNIMIDVNKALAADPRVEICQLSIADGLTLCRRCV